MLHHTRIAVYSCWIFVPTMSSPTETSGTVSTERYYSTWVRTLQSERGWRSAMKPNPSISPKGHITASPTLEIWLTSPSAALPLGVGLGRMPQSFLGHNFILFQEVPWRDVARYLPSTTQRASYRRLLPKNNGRLPAARHWPGSKVTLSLSSLQV